MVIGLGLLVLTPRDRWHEPVTKKSLIHSLLRSGGFMLFLATGMYLCPASRIWPLFAVVLVILVSLFLPWRRWKVGKSQPFAAGECREQEPKGAGSDPA